MGFDPVSDYPLGSRRPDLVRTASGLALDELTIDAVRAGKIEPEDLRATLALFYVEGLKYAEIARVMECPIGTVRSRLFEARERLKKLCETKDAQ